MRTPLILRLFRDKQLLQVKQFDQDQIVIGNKAEVDIDLDSDHVSVIHCLIEKRDNHYYLCDLGSATGTFKNGQAILDEQVQTGDEIKVGPYSIHFSVGVPRPKAIPQVKPATESKIKVNNDSIVHENTSNESVSQKIDTSNVANDTKKSNEAEVQFLELNLDEEKIKNQTTKKVEKTKSQKHSSGGNLETVANVVRPEIKKKSQSQNKTKGHWNTIAPASEYKSIYEAVKPKHGNTVEVLICWKERIVHSYHFRKAGKYSLDHQSILPSQWPLIDISQQVQVRPPAGYQIEVFNSEGEQQTQDLGKNLILKQGEMIVLNNQEVPVSIVVRFIQSGAAIVLPGPGLIGTNEMLGLTMSLILVGLLAFYISVTTPKDWQEQKQDEVQRVAQIILNNPKPKGPAAPPPEPPKEEPKPEPKPEPKVPEKAKLADQTKDAGGNKTEQSKIKQQASKAVEAPKADANRPKKFTSKQQGGDIKIGDKGGANAASAKDVSKTGMLSAFGGGGLNQKLSQAYSGAGDAIGQASKATGQVGGNENREGEGIGSKFKDVGAGGASENSQGIAGVGTRGKSSGTSAYGAADGIGDKQKFEVTAGGAEEAFVGTIDKEAVRRVIKYHIAEVKSCYERSLNKLSKGQTLEGRVVIEWTIVAKGLAKNVKVKSSTVNNSGVETCIANRLGAWVFPEPPTGQVATISYPFVLKPDN